MKLYVMNCMSMVNPARSWRIENSRIPAGMPSIAVGFAWINFAPGGTMVFISAGVKKSADKSFPFAKDMNGKYAVVRIPLC